MKGTKKAKREPNKAKAATDIALKVLKQLGEGLGKIYAFS